MSRHDQLRRILRLLDLLHRSGGLTALEIAGELGISTRTVYRDLATVQEVHFPLEQYREARSVKWRFAEGFKLVDDASFGLEEIVALELARDLLSPLGGSWMGLAIRELMSKVRARVSPQARHYVDAARSVFVTRIFGGRSYGAHEEHLRILLDAIQSRTRLRMVYDSRSTRGQTSRQVDPYVLFLQDGALYLVGHDERRREVRTFAVHRIKTLQTTAVVFPTPNFDLDDYLGRSFRFLRGDGAHLVRVRLGPEIAPYEADRIFHPTQTRKDFADGSVELSFELSALPEVRDWILGFGGHAQALAPAELRDSVLEAARGIVAAHEAAPRSKNRTRGSKRR